MEEEHPKLLWTPEIALRSKEQVLLEEWGTTDQTAILRNQLDRVLTVPPPPETWTTLKPTAGPNGATLYYQAQPCPPILTKEEFDDAVARNTLHRTGYCHAVCRIGDTVVKMGADPNVIEEAENLLYLAEKRPELRIPTLLAAWSVQSEVDTPIYFLMMENIDGILLDNEKFAALPIHAQDIICAKISSQLRYLRELPSEGYYGRVHGRGWLSPPPALTSNTAAHHVVVGPYRSYEEYCGAMYRSKQVQDAAGNWSKEWHPTDQGRMDQFITIFQGWEPNEPKLTWADPKIDNFIARKITKDDGSEDWEVFLIDWECLGWYPAWTQGLQISKRFGILLRDPVDRYVFHRYRLEETKHSVIKAVDPEVDWGRLDRVREYPIWRFF